MSVLRDYIRANETLAAFADAGNDAAIAAALNAVDGTIQVSREYIPADYLKALAVAAYNTAAVMGDATKIARWQGAVAAASGFNDPILLTDPVLAAQLSQATTDGVLSQELKDYYTKRAGSISEREFGKAVSVDDVSAALSVDRPNGIVGAI